MGEKTRIQELNNYFERIMCSSLRITTIHLCQHILVYTEATSVYTQQVHLEATVVQASCTTSLASFPVPRPAFRRLQYCKAGRAWYIFSREHDVIEKCRAKFSERRRYVLRVIQPSTRSTLGEYDSRPPLARYVWYVTWYLRSSCCSETHVRPRFLPVFLPLSTLDVTHVRRCTRPSPLYRTKQRRKAGRGTGYEATTSCCGLSGTHSAVIQLEASAAPRPLIE